MSGREKRRFLKGKKATSESRGSPWLEEQVVPRKGVVLLRGGSELSQAGIEKRRQGRLQYFKKDATVLL